MEFRRKCTVCGKIYCYTDKDIRDNNLNSISASASTLGAVASLFGGTRLDTYALNSQADRYSSKIVNFEQCPNCHSISTISLSDEEWAELQKQTESSGGMAVKTIEINANATVESLLKRAYLFLEDAEWQTADAYFEKILDVEPENAQAYLGKLLAELQLSTISELQTCAKAFEESANWKKALRFADEKLSAELQQYVLEHTYRMGVSAKMAAQSETDYRTAAEYFSRIAGFRDADQLAEQCLNIAGNEPKYKQAVALQRQDTMQSLEQAAAIYEVISSYKDSARNAETCQKRIPVLQEIIRQKEKIQTASKKRNRIIAAIAGIAVVLIIAVAVVITQVVIPGNVYKQAEGLLAAGDYYGAATTFSKAGSYNDAKDRAFDLWGEITNRATIAAGYKHTVGVRSDGTVVAVGDNSKRQCNVSSWTDIVAVAVGSEHTVGLKSDGTVVAVGDNSDGQCDVSKWKGIVSVAAGSTLLGGYNTIGLKPDGTVVTTARNYSVSNWTDIVAVTAGSNQIVGLKSNGAVVIDGRTGNLSDWTDIKLPNREE